MGHTVLHMRRPFRAATRPTVNSVAMAMKNASHDAIKTGFPVIHCVTGISISDPMRVKALYGSNINGKSISPIMALPATSTNMV